ALAVGADRSDIQEYLETHYEDAMALDGGIDLALSALAEVNNGSLAPEHVGLATIGVDDGFATVDDATVREHLESLDMLEEPGEE
ncbi:MAG: proteasome subunit alpha, partial [Halobacteriales archaeon]